jgi:hypothetical protein
MLAYNLDYGTNSALVVCFTPRPDFTVSLPMHARRPYPAAEFQDGIAHTVLYVQRFFSRCQVGANEVLVDFD